MTLALNPVSDALGVEIGGVDLAAPMRDETFTQIEAAFDAHGVIVFRDQTITPAQQVAFSRRFGAVALNHNAKDFGIDGDLEIYVISNATKDGRPVGAPRAGGQWHTDMCYAPKPARATMLHAVEVPVLHGLSLGDTCFANTAAAWDSLPDDLQRFVENRRAIFDFQGRKRSRPIAAETLAKYPPVNHPIARTHPRTGRKGLYVMRDDCTGIEGMETGEAQALIAALADHITRPENVYRHRWRKGDVVVWDNCTVQHKAIFDYGLPQRRIMWRTTIEGSAPV
ncbi:MAG: TauD/TfdA dioxygenase family protein [Alphaproteobacteria bacterium]|jgi:taurine dioxygenase